MTAYIPAPLRETVRQRAAGRCEYCRVHEDDNYMAHEADHIVSLKHGGPTTSDNLAYACFLCNRYKGSDIGSIDAESGQFVGFFNPRLQVWEDHFRHDGIHIVPLTAAARATERILQLNHSHRLLERAVLLTAGRYP